MRKVIVFLGGCWLVFATAITGTAGEGRNASVSSDAAQVQQMQERMMNDPEMLNLVMGLQADPEVQALLKDPKVIEAVQAGDYTPLLKDPRLQKLLENARVKELGRRLGDQGPKGAE